MPSYSGVFSLKAQMQAVSANNWPLPPPSIGQAYQGGFFAGQISTTANGVATHNLVVGPVASAQSSKAFKESNTATTGAVSVIDGPQNTLDIVADGNSTVYPAAHFCNDLVTGGYSDWYMPAKNELEICYYNLKPTTQNNNTSSGINANAVPARASNYTTGNPTQTSSANFQSTGSEAFVTSPYYWSSTNSNPYAFLQGFNNGYAGIGSKSSVNRVRAVRRVAV
jgi:hypothetical protein